MTEYFTQFFSGERVWRTLTNFWTYVFLAFILLDFFNGGRFSGLNTPLSILYVGVLTLYVGTKEFERWYELHEGRHPGELFVLGWTAVMAVLFIATFLSGGERMISSEVVADYIAVLSIYAVTQQSKRLWRLKRGTRIEA